MVPKKNKKLGLLCPLQPDTEEEENEKKKKVGDRGVPEDWIEAYLRTASHLSGAFMKGRHLPLGEALEGGVAPPGAFHNYAYNSRSIGKLYNIPIWELMPYEVNY